jgi:hypothetical protein
MGSMRPPALPTHSLALLALALALAACGGRPVTEPSSPATPTKSTPAPTESPTTATPTTTPETSPVSPTRAADVQVPPGAPTTFEGDVAAAAVPIASLAPPKATISSWWTAPSGSRVDALMFGWSTGSDPLRRDTGFEVWMRSPGAPVWRAAYAFFDRPSSGVLGLRFENGDLTGDAIPDALTFEDIGGSGACGTWRVVRLDASGASELFSKQTCDTDVRIVDGDLQMRESVYAPGDAHCCPSAYRTTTLRWDGQGWEIVRRRTTPA